MQIFNSLSGKKETLKKQAKKPLRLFVCGPTVYDYTHIGHARSYIFFDFFVKYLRSRGWKVFYLQNITNIDDKIIKRAAEEREDPVKLADSFTKEYLKDMKTLGVSAVNKYASATDFIPEIVAQVERLVKKGYAYKIEGDGWYYDIAKFKDYGKLSHRTALQAEDSVSRIDESIAKRNRGDFCLWKFSPSTGSGQVKPGEPTWKSKLGDGRPGWHIEDTAISEHYFGPQYDLHGGGLDLKFPHHEAEIAQQEAASGKKPFVKIWMHPGMLTVDGEKMSKSLGNFVTVRSFLENRTPSLLRFLFLNHHYRSPINYEHKLIEDAKRTLANVGVFLGKLDFFLKSKHAPGKKKANCEQYQKPFFEALDDDVNTPVAFSLLFNFIGGVNKNLWHLDRASAAQVKKAVEKSFGMFGITFPSVKIPQKIRDLAVEREESRNHQQFTQSDRLRKKIIDLGYVTEDTPIGQFIWPQK